MTTSPTDTNRVRVGRIDSPLGPFLAGATDEGLCLLEFTDRIRMEAQLEAIRRRFGAPPTRGGHPHLDQVGAELEEYFAGARREFTVPLAPRGSAFDERVWAELRRIPYGQTRSYEAMALTLGLPGAQRAVGTANGRNPIAVVVPCHRVVNKSGKLGGYGGGLWRKQALLDLESGGQPPLALRARPSAARPA